MLLRPLAVAAAALAMNAAPAGAQTEPVGVSPAPGTPTASPRTEISFRFVDPGALGPIAVSGSRTGPRTGRVVAHSDGRGASLVFDRPFAAGEEVSVDTTLPVAGTEAGDWTFDTVARPRRGLQSGAGGLPPALAEQLFGQRGRPPRGRPPRYRSRPDLRPPEVEILRGPRRGLADGYIFLSPKKVFGARERPGIDAGALIVDDRGEPVWFADPRGDVNDFRVQEYGGRPLLTWWAGRQVLGTGEGVLQGVDQRYAPAVRVEAGNGYAFDFHEALVTDRGTFMGIVYSPVRRDLRPIGGERGQRVVDGVVQEVDIATGRVVFEWHSLGHIPLRHSYVPVPPGGSLYDYLHLNSVDVDDDGNLLVSARDAHAVYKIDRLTGEVIWTLGGKSDDFGLERSERMAWQHDVRRAPDGTIRVFDNQAAPRVRPRSRVIWYRLDEARTRVRAVRQFEHPDGLSTGTQGNAQALPNGNTMIGWGSQGYFTEIDEDGRVLLDGRVARGNDTYRAYRFEWTGRPDARPAVAARARGRRTAVWASWNGATEVRRWAVLAGDDPDDLRRVASGPRTGFESSGTVPTRARYVAVQALGADGEVLRTSEAERVRGR